MSLSPLSSPTPASTSLLSVAGRDALAGDLVHGDPFTPFVGAFDRFEHPLDGVPVCKTRPKRPVASDRAEELVVLVNDGVFPPESVPRGPPRLAVGVVLAGDEDPLVPPVVCAGVPQFVQPFQREPAEP